MTDWSQIRYFKPWEFDSPDEPGSGSRISLELVRKLDAIRHDYGSPLNINSGVRTARHNAEVGGVDSSAHVDGLAADIRVSSSYQRYMLLGLALSKGVPRIGIGRSFLHLDVDTSKPQFVVWLY